MQNFTTHSCVRTKVLAFFYIILFFPRTWKKKKVVRPMHTFVVTLFVRPFLEFGSRHFVVLYAPFFYVGCVHHCNKRHILCWLCMPFQTTTFALFLRLLFTTCWPCGCLILGALLTGFSSFPSLKSLCSLSVL